MKITVGQFNVKSKDIQHNLDQMIALIKKAISKDYEMIVFGEYALVGYGCSALFHQHTFYEELEEATQLLKQFSDDITIVFGSVRKEHNNSFVTAVIIDHNHITYSDKENLNKRELKETVYFSAGKNKSYKDFLVTFASDTTEDSTKTKIVLDSSPVNNIKHYAANTVYANIAGITHVNKVVFINGGNSYVKLSDKMYSFEYALDEGLSDVEKSLHNISKLKALTYGIKHFSKDNFGNNKKWIVGNSGGLDSAVTLSLLTIALGKEFVISYNLKSKYNSPKTINNAQHLANQLGIRHSSHAIDDAVEGYLKTLEAFNYDQIPTLAYENIQARTRGHLLGGFSSLEDAIISNNGNKLEIMLGYATLYGDTIGALSSIGDLTKVEVFELALEINEYFKREVIPTNLLPKVENYTVSFDLPPTAELKSDQVDPMKWYYHDLLTGLVLTKSKEEILSMYFKDQFAPSLINKWLPFYKLDNGKNFIEDFNWFMRTFEISNFKRMQMPPILAYSNHVIGVDFEDSAFIKPKSQQEIDLEAKIIKKYK